jgi:hypothetical protein
MEGPTTLNQSIVKFLESASSAKNTTPRCRCGATMKYQKTTIFYEGKGWEVELPVCVRCNPSPSAPSHDA